MTCSYFSNVKRLELCHVLDYKAEPKQIFILNNIHEEELLDFKLGQHLFYWLINIIIDYWTKQSEKSTSISTRICKILIIIVIIVNICGKPKSELLLYNVTCSVGNYLLVSTDTTER